MDFLGDNSSQGGTTFPTLGIFDGVIYSNVLSNNLRNELPLTSGILTSRTLSVSSNINFSGKTTINNNIYAIGRAGIGYADNAVLNSNFNVLGTADFSSNMNVGGSLTQTGTSNNFIFGKTTFNSNLVVSANNRLYAIGNVGVGYVDNAALNSNFNVLGTADFSSNMNIAGSLTQTGTSNITLSGNVAIGTNNPVSRLTVNQHPAHGGSFDFSTCPMTITNRTPTSSSALNDPRPILHLCREGTGGSAWASKATFNLCRYENASSSLGSRTRLDISLSHNSFDDVNIMSIRSDGNVGIGTTNPQNNFDVFGTNCKFAIRATQEDQSATLYLGTAFSNAGVSANVYKTALIAAGISNHSRSRLHFCLNNSANNIDSATITDARMTIREDGNVGIGTTNPQTQLHLHASTNSTNVFLKLTDNSTGITVNDGITFEKNTAQDLFVRNAENARMYLFTNNIVRIAIQANGNVGIVDPNTQTADGTANIFQVGSGERLRISNGNNDFTRIGTSDTTGVNNTCITISGSGRSPVAGFIDYEAINRHRFWTTSTGTYNEILTIMNTGNVGIGITNPFAPLCIGTPAINGSDGALVISKRTAAGSGFRNFKFGYDDAFNFCMGDFGGELSGNTWRPTDFNISYQNGNIGIGTLQSASHKLNVNGSINSTSLWQNGTQIDFNSYLLKSGGVMTGNLEISKTTPTITLRGTGTTGAIARLNLSTYDFATNEPSCSIITTDDGNFGSSFDIRLKTPGALANSQTSALFIKNDRNVGIGTTNPQTLLDVRGIQNIQLDTTGTPGIGTYGSGGGNRLILWNGNASVHPYGFGIAASTIWYGCPDGSRHEFYTGNTRVLFINSTSIQTPNPITINGQTGATNLLDLTSSTTTDVCRMKISGPGGIQLFIGMDGTTAANTLTRSNAYLITSGNLIFFTNNRTAEANLLISTNGNVGIATNNPVLTLQVGSTNASHNIGRAILTAGNIHDADKRDFLSIGRWDGISTSDMSFTGIRYGVITGADSGESFNNHSCITFHTWGNNISTSREVMRINSRGVLSILGQSIFNYLFNNTGANHGDISNFDSVSHFGYKFIQGTTSGPGTPSAAQYYSWYIGLGANHPATGNGSYGAQFALPRNVTNPVMSIRFNENNSWSSWSGITAAALTSGDKTISGKLTVDGLYGIIHSSPNISLATIDSNNHANTCYYTAFAGDTNLYSYWGCSINLNSSGLNPSGNASYSRIAYTSSFTINHKPIGGTAATTYNNLFTVRASGNIGIGTTDPKCTLQVNGIGNFNGGSPHSTAYNYMQTGSLTIGDTLLDYGGGTNWNGNTAGLMMECLNGTEIAIHDTASRIASFMYYVNNTFTIGRDMGWNAISSVNINGNVGIGTHTPGTRLHIEHSSTTFNGASGGLYLFNPNNTANSSSCLGARIGGPLANRAGVSLDVSGQYGWSMYINGNDATNRRLIFNSSWDGTGSERLTIRGNDGNVGIATNNPVSRLTVNEHPALSSSFNFSTCPMTITNRTVTSSSALNDPIPILHLCREGTSGQAWASKATFNLCRYENAGTGNVGSRTRLDLALTHDAFNDVNIMSIRSDGTVGIGVTNPVTRLEVGSFAYTTPTINARYFHNDTPIAQGPIILNIVCCKLNGVLWVTSAIASSSDERIKTNINDIIDDSALQKILQIQPKTYEYIDKIQKGTDKVYGFIAQQIKEIIPEAVNIEKSLIPNIYSICDCSSNIINLQSSNIEKIKINDKISIIEENKNINSYIITDIIKETNQIKINSNLESSKCFVYGTEIDDFHTLDKSYIYTLNVCATQELYRQIQEQKTKIDNLQMQIDELKQLINK